MKSTLLLLLLALSACSSEQRSGNESIVVPEKMTQSPEKLPTTSLEASPPVITEPTSEDVKTVCKLLCTLTNKAITGQRKDQIAIYYNSYEALRSAYTVPESIDQYFKQIKTTYASNIGDWVIGLRAQPSAYLAGGFSNNEVSFINRVRSSGIAPESIDLEQVKWYQQLQGDTFDVTQLKSSEIERLKLLKSKLKQLDLEHVEQQKKAAAKKTKANRLHVQQPGN